jgi:xanthine dehydrogenase YagR molybdenum-binding subunit
MAVIHRAIAETSSHEQYVEGVVDSARFLHSCPNVATRYGLLPLDVHTPVYMRAPGTASGIFALECAMDELAYELRMDPIELRLRNEPQKGRVHQSTVLQPVNARMLPGGCRTFRMAGTKS